MADDRLLNLLGAAALSASDVLRADVDAAAGLGGSGPAALVHLHAHPGGSVEELRRVLGISQPVATRLVERLVAEGLVARAAGADRRTHALGVTAAGRRRAEAVLTRRAAALEPLLAPLGAADRATLERLLGAVVAGLAPDRPAALRTCRLCDRRACEAGGTCPLWPTAS